MTKLFSVFKKHQPDIEALSARLDGQLDAASVTALEKHLPGCDACRAADAGLREAKAMLAALPEVGHPRSFRLRQADVEAPARPSPARQSSGPMRWAPACAAISAVVFAVVLGADLATRDSNSSTQFSSLESSERIGMAAADDSFDGDAAAPGVAPGGAIENGGAGSTPPETGEGQADTPPIVPNDAAAPTGEPPSGDEPVAGAPEIGDTTAQASTGEDPAGSTFLPPTPTPATLGALPPEGAADDPAQRGSDGFSQNDNDNGNRWGFLFVEVAAAGTAMVALAAWLIWRRRRGQPA